MPRILFLLLLTASAAQGDEFRTSSGRTVRGTLALSSGELSLRDATGTVLARGDNLPRVTLGTTRQAFRETIAHQIQLSEDECLSGVFLGMQKETLFLRTAWSDQVTIPRWGAKALTHLPGWRPILQETFAGKPLRLDRPGTDQEISLKAPLPAGRINVLFQEHNNAKGARWLVEAEYVASMKTNTITVTLASNENSLSVDSPNLKGIAYLSSRVREKSKLTLTHSASSLRITCNDEALFHSIQTPGRLRSLKLRCLPIKDAKTQGHVTFYTLAIDAAEPSHRRPKGDTSRDELWLTSGDQLFGKITRVDTTGIEITGRFRPRLYLWRELRGWYPRQSEGNAIPAKKGVAVRIEVDSGLSSQADILDGMLTSLTSTKIIFHHRVLGELSLPRSRILALTPTRPE